MNENEKVETKVEETTDNAKVETPPVAQETVAAAPVKETLGQKLKKHWKGVTATIVGVGTAAGSAVVAYRKGKAAGIMSVPQQEADDYSLDPNRE